MLGILMLDTAFPRIRGDIGSAETFNFPVRFMRVERASVDTVVHTRDDDHLLPRFVAAGRELARSGCDGIVTTCGFLARWQRELADALPVPVLTSALFAAPLVMRTLPSRCKLGIVTYSAADLDATTLESADIDADTPIAGIDPDSYFARTIRDGRTDLVVARMRDDTVAAARALVAEHPEVGAIVLECANMPPYRSSVREAVNRPIFDAAELFAWFHSALK